MTYAVLQPVRDRSIQVRARRLEVPSLNDPRLMLKGAGQYAAMCADCHLAPGVEDSDMRSGMYPQPPNIVAKAPPDEDMR